MNAFKATEFKSESALNCLIQNNNNNNNRKVTETKL